MLIRDVLRAKGRHIEALPEAATLAVAIEVMAARGFGSVLVTGADGPRGVVSETDVLCMLREHGAAALSRPISAALKRPLPTCSPDEAVFQVLARMTAQRLRHLIVCEAGVIYGIVSIGDIVKARLANIELEAGVLRDMARGHLLATG